MDDDVTYYVKGEKIGQGAFKVVYKAIDRRKGIEVAWNELDINKDEIDYKKIAQEVEILSGLDNEHVLHFYKYWIDTNDMKLVFITELMTSGSLRSFVKQAGFFSLRAIKEWCRQILEGLNYLHTLKPPIIHRDIKLDNIFIGSKGKVKIGDLGLATEQKKNAPMSVIGTPEFMAPEFYDGKYDEKVDVWAFGLCVIEMATVEYPYNECSNVVSIYKTVSSGLKPQALAKIKDATIVEFVCSCLEVDVSKRISSGQLLKHEFLKIREVDDAYVELRNGAELEEVFHILGTPPTLQGWETWTEIVTRPVKTQMKELKRKRSSLDTSSRGNGRRKAPSTPLDSYSSHSYDSSHSSDSDSEDVNTGASVPNDKDNVCTIEGMQNLYISADQIIETQNLVPAIE